jgi:CheY-like chemotaxis protein
VKPTLGAQEVLVVDDDPGVRAFISILLERNGIATRVADSGSDAFRLLELRKCDFCAVILDLNLPPPDGIEIARYIRDTCPELPVIVVSGYSDFAERLTTEDLGSVVKYVLRKPIDTAALVRYLSSQGCLSFRIEP